MKSPQAARNKAPAIRFLLILGVLFLLLLFLNLLLDGTLATWFQKPPVEPERGPIFFYEVDYDLDVFSEEEYISLERRLRYTDGAQTILIADEADCANTGEVATFFFHYFDAIIRGDATSYNACFTDEYRKEYGVKERFTMQQLYESEVTKLREYTINEGTPQQTTVYEFRVGYRIRRNNGTFRDDVPSNEMRPQIYQLYKNDLTEVIGIQLISEYNIKQ